MCAQSKLKVRSKNIELVRSNGRVSDTSSPEMNLWPATSPAAPGAWSRCRSFSLLLPERESSRMSAEAVMCRIMVRYAPLVSQRPKPSRVIGRMRAASQRCRRQRSVFRRLQRCCERCRVRRGTCLPVYGTFLAIHTTVSTVRLAALSDTLLPHICDHTTWTYLPAALYTAVQYSIP